MNAITRDVLHQAFELIAQELAELNMTAEFYLFGGSNMVYSYGSRSRTDEVDASFRRSAEFTGVLRSVAERLSLPSNWIDIQAYRWEPDTYDTNGRVVFEHPNFRVVGASPEHMLAMKLKAAESEIRADKDIPDIEFLVKELDIRYLDQANEIYKNVWPEDDGGIPRHARSILIDIVGLE